LQIQDTPGYGDELNLNVNIARVKALINEQNELWMKCETQPTRGEMTKRVDPRIDICLFCLPPHRVRNIDMEFMHQISQVRTPQKTNNCSR
jgi:septin family protein